jgi:hypothetical protein
MAEPRYRYQEPRCYTLTLTWLPAEDPEDIALPDEEPPPPTRHTHPLRPHVHNRPRDVVRHHRLRRLRRVVWIVRRERREDLASGRETESDVQAIARRRARTSARCQCSACRCRDPKPLVRDRRLAAHDAADDAELVPSWVDEDETRYHWLYWYRNDYPDGPHQWPPDCNDCPVADCWDVDGGEACRKSMARQHRLDLAPEDEH